VFAQQGEHVVEKRNAGGNVGSSSAIELDGDTDAGFRCFAVLACGTCIHELMAIGCLQWGWFAMAFFLSQGIVVDSSAVVLQRGFGDVMASK